MAQKTAKTVEDVLEWIETTPHHRASWIEEEGFFVLQGHHHKLRIPEAIQEKTRGLVRPGDPMDQRMYRATKTGRAKLRKAKALSVNPQAQVGEQGQ